MKPVDKQISANNSETKFSDTRVNNHVGSWDETDTVPIAVVEAVASMTGQDATEMEPLGEVVDTDALDDLFKPAGKAGRSVGAVEFEYSNCLVRVSAGGRLEVAPLNG
ncbi:HalOD1 output domain-containing protein [Halovenus sp. HT40]|uniref:HalOD1 output domain-containing protein n=1 Tax=Halovenus sp. HT40 TaxID=3126691 RepID=UPI00300ED292